MQLVHPKYCQLDHSTEKNDWVLCSVKPQESPTKGTTRKLIFERFDFLDKERIPKKKRMHNK